MDLKVARTTIHDSDYYIIYPLGEINKPILMLPDWQFKKLIEDAGFELAP